MNVSVTSGNVDKYVRVWAESVMAVDSPKHVWVSGRRVAVAGVQHGLQMFLRDNDVESRMLACALVGIAPQALSTQEQRLKVQTFVTPTVLAMHAAALYLRGLVPELDARSPAEILQSPLRLSAGHKPTVQSKASHMARLLHSNLVATRVLWYDAVANGAFPESARLPPVNRLAPNYLYSDIDTLATTVKLLPVPLSDLVDIHADLYVRPRPVERPAPRERVVEQDRDPRAQRDMWDHFVDSIRPASLDEYGKWIVGALTYVPGASLGYEARTFLRGRWDQSRSGELLPSGYFVVKRDTAVPVSRLHRMRLTLIEAPGVTVSVDPDTYRLGTSPKVLRQIAPGYEPPPEIVHDLVVCGGDGYWLASPEQLRLQQVVKASEPPISVPSDLPLWTASAEVGKEIGH